ncbi:MAG: hypothetical protein IT331_07050 [Anaerolineae bacterium]|nr:hypothetical protein [Anaerolineae bacterium]
MKDPIKLLAIGDRRTIGKSAEVARAILRDPLLFDPVFDAMWKSADPGVRMRAANVCEAVTRARPDLLAPRKKDLLEHVSLIEQQEVRWHYCQMLPRVPLTPGERRRAFAHLKTFANDKSGIVRTFSLQAMFDLAEQDRTLRAETRDWIIAQMKNGTPAVKSRGRKLLRTL